jgi:MFS family permease
MADFPPSSRRSSASVSPPGEVEVVEGSHAVLEKHQVHHEIEESECQYITFETEIPVLSTRTLRDGSILHPPNLKQFQSPFHWSSTRKNVVLFISCGVTMLAGYTAGSYSMAAEQLQSKWALSNVSFNTGVTTWAVGFACSPMMLAPLSEINGRRPVFIGSGVLLLVALVGSAVTESFAGMLVARFFVGAGASTFATMVGGVVSDIYHAEDRNTPMAIYSGFALAGTGLGPFCSGFITERVLWRWVFYTQIISVGIILAVIISFFNETRGSVLLSRKAQAVNSYYDKLAENGLSTTKIRYRVASDEARASLRHLLYLSLTTPFKLLFTEPVVFFFSLWIAFAWAVLYMTFDAIPLVFQTRHNFTVGEAGAVFAAICIGSIVGTILSICQERIARQHMPKLASTPEGRLYFACIQSALLPVGLFWFGWTSSSSIHWIVPVLALGCAQIGIFSIYLAVFNYLADCYHRFASSALAGQSFLRNILAAIFPLFTNVMFRRLSYPGASSLLGGISAVLTLVPWVLLFYGPKIRARSKIAGAILVQES